MAFGTPSPDPIQEILLDFSVRQFDLDRLGQALKLANSEEEVDRAPAETILLVLQTESE